MRYTDQSGKERIKLVSEVRGNKEGFRIVNLECLEMYITEISIHSIQCSKSHELSSPVEVLGEVWAQGLASVIAARCKGCGKCFELKSPRMRGDKKIEINVRAVWGQMVTGGGASKMGEQMATMGMPSMTQSTFSSIEEEIGVWWKQVCKSVLM